MTPGTLTSVSLGHTLLGRGPLRAGALGLSLAAALAVAWALPLTESVALRTGLREALGSSAVVTVEQADVTDFDGFVGFERLAASRVEARVSPYLVAGAAFASIAPLPPRSIDDQPVAGADLSASYLDGLAGHVEMVAGTLPPDGLGGPLPAVTMPQSGADRLGLRPGDRLCVGLKTGGLSVPWCARVVGMWRPRRLGDPYWGGGPPSLTLVLGLYDFFELLKLGPPQGALVGLRYVPDPSAVGPAGAGDLSERLRQLRVVFPVAGPQRLDLPLAPALDRYRAAQRPATLTLNVLTTSLVLLALCLVQLTASRLVDLQARDVGLLRARGWPPGPAWRLLYGQLCAVALLALPVGLAGAALATAALAAGAGSEARPGAGDLAVAAVALVAVLASAAVLLAVVAWSAASREPGQEASALGPITAWWRRRNVDLPLAAMALALVLARPAGGLPGAAGGLVSGEALRFVAPVLAVTILGLVALRALPLAGQLAGRGRADLPATLARWQLLRRPDQHSGLVFFVVLTLSTAGFCALSLAAEPRPVAALAAIHDGRQAVLGAVLVAVLTMGLSGSWLHFRAAATARRHEYAALALNGLPAAAARSSLGIEQTVILAYGVGIGTLLALTLGATLLADVTGGGVDSAPADLLSGAAAWASLPAGLGLVSWLVRRASFSGDLLEELRR